METLILHPGGLGDIILSLPAIALVREHCPSARITLAGNVDHLAAIVSGYAEKIVSLSTLPLHRLYAQDPPPEPDVQIWRSFDWIVSWTGSGDPDFIRNFGEIHANVRIAPWRPKTGEKRHVSRLFIDSLGMGVSSEMKPAPAPIYLNPVLRGEGRSWLTERGWDGRDPLIALHPGAGSITKRWPLVRFIHLARHLVLQEKRKLLIIEGPAEQSLAKQVAQALSSADGILAESLPLNLLASILGQCSSFIGNDSGIAHLAAALGVRSLVLFGPTPPQHWAPLGQHVTVIRNKLDCEGCAAGGKLHTCLENITVADVIRRLSL